MSRQVQAQGAGFYNQVGDVMVSSLGIGTAREGLSDAECSAAIEAALNGGINLIDTSLSYRNQLAERATGSAIRAFVRNGGQRDEIVVCTKAGYLVAGAIPESGLRSDEIVGTHCVAPAFLTDQLQRSRANLGLDTIDVYYLHNPETQLMFVDRGEFMRRIRTAFETLERCASDHLLRYYGVATWSGFRDGLSRNGLSLAALADAAREVAGEGHRFRFVQLPFNLCMTEARTFRPEGGETALDVARRLNLGVVASATLLRASLSRNLPRRLAGLLPNLATDAQRAIQFTRSTPGIVSALVGMGKLAHLGENLGVSRVPPLTLAEYERLFAVLS